MKSGYTILQRIEELDTLIKYCKYTGIVSLDFETNAYPVHDPNFKPTILGVSFQPGHSYIIPLAHRDSPFKNEWEKVLIRFAKSILLDPDIIKMGWNLLFENRIFLKYGINYRGAFFDVMIMKYLLNEERPNDLKSVVSYLLPDFDGYDLPNQPGESTNQETLINFWTNIDLETLSEYCGLDCDCTLRLGLHFNPKLIKHDLYGLFRNLYGPLIRIYSHIILNGINIDRVYLKYLYNSESESLGELVESLRDIPVVKDYQEMAQEIRVNEYIKSLKDRIEYEDLSDTQIRNIQNKLSYLMMGQPTTKKEEKLFEPLNLGSPVQLRELLYKSEWGFEFPILDKSEKGEPSTAEDTLLKLRDYDESGFIDGLLEYRGKATLYTTFVKGIYLDHLTEMDRIHPGYLLHGTVTGRLSSRGPNIQNIPRVTTGDRIKLMFVAPKDHYFVEFDQSQAELRIAAEMSGDKAMIEIFEKGQNIHVATAARMFGVDYNYINKARKDENDPNHLDAVRKHKAAKVLNFTIFYGAGPTTVASFLTKNTGVKHTSKDAIDFINLWFEAFPDTEKWIKRIHKKVTQTGYVRSIFKRKRRLPILLKPSNEFLNKGAWAQALRLSINSPIQGTASDLTQWVLLQTYRAMINGDIPFSPIVSSVHDSIEFYIHKTQVHQTYKVIESIGEMVPELEDYLGYSFKYVPLKLSAELGISWGIMHEYSPSIDYVKFYDEEWDKYDLELYPHIKYNRE